MFDIAVQDESDKVSIICQFLVLVLSIPSLVDVHNSRVPFLVVRFSSYGLSGKYVLVALRQVVYAKCVATSACDFDVLVGVGISHPSVSDAVRLPFEEMLCFEFQISIHGQSWYLDPLS